MELGRRQCRRAGRGRRRCTRRCQQATTDQTARSAWTVSVAYLHDVVVTSVKTTTTTTQSTYSFSELLSNSTFLIRPTT